MVKINLKYPINKEVLLPRLDDVSRSIKKLKELQKIDKKEFIKAETNHWALTSYFLQRALEGLLSCGSHILSRIPGVKFDEYATITLQLTEYEILPAEFKKTAIQMAKYRNRLVHFYHKIEREELYNILHSHLTDLEKFQTSLLKFVQKS
jgi:uncharacterized protein YutE (UPF0331/DUF86 family)